MRTGIAGWLLTVALLVAWPAAGYAQEATLMGTVTDTTGGVLPGVTVVAVHEATGNTFEAVTDGTGSFRMLVRVGAYRVTAQLQGFQTVTRTNVQLLLGQQQNIGLELPPATLQETVTVTGEAPLIDTTSSTVGTNIDPMQVEELPVNGRNWMDLALLAPGARRNDMGEGGFIQDRQGYAQTVIDGQQVTTIYHSGGDTEQPRFSRDAIAEFEVISNRFDATQGRSAGMIVNAITKSGTNTLSGSLSGYFRHDKFNAKDFFRDEVLPFQNQQLSATTGGPIIQDRLHFFGAYEYEREPRTFIWNTEWPTFNIDQQVTKQIHYPMGRVDYQITPRTRASVRTSWYTNWFGSGGGTTVHPSNLRRHGRIANQQYGTFTQVLGGSSVNEIKGGRTSFDRRDGPQDGIGVGWKGGPFPYNPVLDGGSVVVRFPGLTIGTVPLNIQQYTQSLRDDFTTSYNAGGRHDLKLGAEYLRFHNTFKWCLRCTGDVDARDGPVPANVEALFPVWNDASTWDLSGIPSEQIRRVRHSTSLTTFGGEHRYEVVRHILAGWAQDDWHVSNRLTLNLGVRYDWDSNGHSERLEFRPWLPGNLPRDNNNVAPRLGMAYQVTDETVIRGGYGLFFAFAPNDGVQQSAGYTVRFEGEYPNDGRPDFNTNWFGPGPSPEGQWGGPKPSAESQFATACDATNSAPGCTFRALVQEINYPDRDTSYSHQASIGFQHQLADGMAIEANYVYTGGRGEEDSVNGNLTYDPATGANIPFQNVAARPFPDWGAVNFEFLDAWSNYHQGDFSFTKRFSDNWQLNANYTLAYFRDAQAHRDQWFIGADGIVDHRDVGFPLARDLGGDYTFASSDQRHRATINGIWDIAYGIQLSGLYFFGSGERFSVDVGRDNRREGSQSEERLRSDGTIVPRNSLTGEPLHRVDLRLMKRVPLGGVTIDGIVEVFNLFNHENYGSYVTNEASRAFGNPSPNNALAYAPRQLQFGFRLAF